MRVIRSAGQNISPSDDGALFHQILTDGLFEDVAINSLGSNQVAIPALYGIIQGREFTNSAETIDVALPDSGTSTGYIYIQYDLAANPIGTIGSALAPFTPTYDDLNSTGTLAQMVIATYQASSVAVTSLTPTYNIAKTHGLGDEVSITLAAASWASDLYTITAPEIKPDIEIVLTYPPTLTDAEYEAYEDADIRPYGAVLTGSMQLKAVGGAPSIDLPMVMIVRA